MSSAAFLLAPSYVPSKNSPETEIDYYRWRSKISSLIYYREGYQKLKDLKNGGTEGYLTNRGPVDELNFGWMGGEELGVLVTMCKKYGGEYLALWSYGMTVHTMLIQSDAPGREPVIREIGFRLVPHSRVGREEYRFTEMTSWFDKSAFQPDMHMLKQEFSGRSISIKSWFGAFGVEGARDLESADATQIWDDFEKVAFSLLRGKPAESSLVRKLNAEIRILDRDSSLAAKPYRKSGLTARMIAAAAATLMDGIEEPSSKAWKDRLRAARFYWDITDCDDALNKLTTGSDKNGWGISASLARLLNHYPVELRRDNLFLAMAQQQVEAANGHAFVAAICSFAEYCHLAGFTLAVFPAAKLQEFRKKFGIEGRSLNPPQHSSWAAEAFLECPSLMKKDPDKKLKAWFAKNKSDGYLLQTAQDGSWKRIHFESGKMITPEADISNDRMADAARHLDFRSAFSALGMADLMEPGKWYVGAYSGATQTDNDHQKNIMKAFPKIPTPVRVADWKELFADFPENIIHKKYPFGSHEHPVIVRITLPDGDPSFSRAVMKDLKGDGFNLDVWIRDGQMWGTSPCRIPISLFIRVLEDTPVGTRLAVDNGKKYHYELSRNAPPPAVSHCLQLEEETKSQSAGMRFSEGVHVEDDVVKQVVLHGKKGRYYRLDLTGIHFANGRALVEAAREMEELGFILLGDLVYNQNNSHVVRGFAGESCYGKILIGAWGDFHLELYTPFQDGSSLTTTTGSSLQKDRPEAKIYSLPLPGTNTVREVWKRHEERLLALDKERGKQPVTVDRTLQGLAIAMEDFLRRQHLPD